MPKDHVGALSGVTYTSPALDDESDIEVAFAEFADSIPAAPKQLLIETVTASKNAELNVMYINGGTGPVTITLPAGQHEGDKVVVYQLGNTGTEVTLVGGAGVSYQGPQKTTGQYTAVTALWHGGKWVGSPFSFSGVRPTASTGGEIVDLNGRRYHVFKTPGAFTFMSHQDQDLRVELIGGGGNGTIGSVGQSGEGGLGGQVVLAQTVHAYGMDYIAVAVPAAGGTARFGSLTALGGSDGTPGVPTPPVPVTPITGDLATILGVSSAGASGGNDVGPVNGTFGNGGGGGFNLVAQTTRPSHVESGTNPTYWVETRPAWDEQVVDHYVPRCGDAPVGNGSGWDCPGGWHVVGGCIGAPYAGVRPYGCQCCTIAGVDPVYKTVHHPAEGYWAGGGSWTNTVWDACPSGYTVGGDGTICVDARSAAAGTGGGGAVVVHYPL